MQNERFYVDITESQREIIRGLADDLQHTEHGVGYPEVPAWSEVISSSGPSGWTIIDGGDYYGVGGLADDLRALCEELALGPKPHRILAGRIRRQASSDLDTSDWPGEDQKPRKSRPRGRKDVAEAWARGEALDGGNIRTDGKTVWSWRMVIGRTISGRKVAYDCRVSRSTSTHCSELFRVADDIRNSV